MAGFIKLSRALKKWQYYGNPDVLSVWIHVLMETQYDDSYINGVLVRKGQCIIGVEKLAKECGLTRSVVRGALKKLSLANQIAITSTNKYTLITLLNWEKYQIGENISPTKSPTLSPSSNQQVTTIEEYKEDKESKYIYTYSAHAREDTFPNGPHGHVRLTHEEWFLLKNDFGEEKAVHLIDQLDYYIEAHPDFVSHNHYASIMYWAEMKNIKKKGERL